MPPAKKNQEPQKPTAPMVAGLAVVLAALAIWAQYPGFAVLWLGLWLASWCTHPPQLTGGTSAKPEPTEHEERELQVHRAWRGMRIGLLNPMPAIRHPLVLLAGLGLALAAWWMPVAGAPWWLEMASGAMNRPVPPLVPAEDPSLATALCAVNAAAAALSTWTIMSALSELASEFEPRPLGTVREIREHLTHEGWRGRAAAFAAALVIGPAIGSTVLDALALAVPGSADILPAPVPQGIGLGLLLGSLVALWLLLRRIGPAWRRRVDTAARWRGLFDGKAVKLADPPRVRRSDRYDDYDLDVIEFQLFRATTDDAIRLRPSIEAAYGDGSKKILILHAYQRDDQGREDRSKFDTFAFRAVVANPEMWPDLSDAATPRNVAQIAADCAITLMGEMYSEVIPISDITPCSAEDAAEDAESDSPDPLFDVGERAEREHGGPQVWEATFLDPDTTKVMKFIQPEALQAAGFGDRIGYFYLTAQESPDGVARIWLGALDDPDFEWADESTPALWDKVRDERAWDGRFELAMPAAQMDKEQRPHRPELSRRARIRFAIAGYDANGRPRASRGGARGVEGVIETMPFYGRAGVDIRVLFDQRLESRMISTIADEHGKAASWVHISPWADRAAAREGASLSTAMRLSWSPVDIFGDPARIPATITPKGAPRSEARDAIDIVMSAIVSRGFDAVKGLRRPTVLSAVNLAGRDAPRSIWQIKLALGEGNTVADVRAGLPKIKQATYSEWAAVTTTDVDGDPLAIGCFLLIGASPGDEDLEFTGPAADRNREYVQRLVWEQAFGDASLTSAAGEAPLMRSLREMPENPKVLELQFQIPPGKSQENFKAAVPKLKAATGNSFIELMPTADQTVATFLASAASPLPFPAPPDWEALERPGFRVPIGTSVDGTTAFVEHKEDAHLLVLGRSGSGKSAALMFMIEAMLLGGSEVYLGDSIKGGTDFAFARPWLRAFATEHLELLAMMEHVYAEGQRRNALRAQYDASHVRDLPEEVRPPKLYAIIDEFSSLMDFDKEQKLAGTEDPDEARDIMASNAETAARRRIGQIVGKIARELRAADVHLVIAGQKLDSTILSKIPGGKAIKSSMAVIALGAMSFGDLSSALKRAQDAPRLDDVKLGRGIYEGGLPPTKIIQSWWCEEDGHAVGPDRMKEILMDKLREKGVDEVERLDLEALAERAAQASKVEVFGEEIDESELVIEEEADFDLGDLDFELDLGEEGAADLGDALAEDGGEPAFTEDEVDPYAAESVDPDESAGMSDLDGGLAEDGGEEGAVDLDGGLAEEPFEMVSLDELDAEPETESSEMVSLEGLGAGDAEPEPAAPSDGLPWAEPAGAAVAEGSQSSAAGLPWGGLAAEPEPAAPAEAPPALPWESAAPAAEPESRPEAPAASLPWPAAVPAAPPSLPWAAESAEPAAPAEAPPALPWESAAPAAVPQAPPRAQKPEPSGEVIEVDPARLLSVAMPLDGAGDEEPMPTSIGPRWASPAELDRLMSAVRSGAMIAATTDTPERAALADLLGAPVAPPA